LTTIGTATLQIIPSLLGVSEAIEKQLPSQPVEVKVQPKVDQPAAQKAGKEVGEAVTKSVNDAVKKGDIGKTVGDEIKSSTKKSSPGKEAAQIFIDGLVKGIGQGLRERFGANGIGGQVADSLKSGDIEGAAGHITGTISGIGDTVKTVTDKIADIGSTFGLQLDGVRDFGVKSDGVLGGVTNDVQGVVDKTMEVKGKFGEVGDFLETVLPGKAGKGAAAMVAALEGPAALLAALNIGVSKLPKDMQSIAASTIPGVSPTFKDQGPDAPWYKRDATMDIFRWLKDRSGHSVGGAVAGPGGTDNVLSWLTAGEGVITKDAMTRGGAPLMAALNAGWSPSPDLLKALLPGFSDGGMVGPDVEAALKLVGVPYSQAKRNDCSGTVAQIINAALGMTGSGLMSTKNAESWLTARGFKAGSGGPGTIRVGWYDHGPNPNDGHMAMTLSDGRNAESGGSVGPFTIGHLPRVAQNRPQPPHRLRHRRRPLHRRAPHRRVLASRPPSRGCQPSGSQVWGQRRR
jgi:hypothetical protein